MPDDHLLAQRGCSEVPAGATYCTSVGALLGPTRVVPGCTGCPPLYNYENLNAFTLVEEWTSQAALDQHLASDAYAKTLVGAIDLSAEPPRVQFDTVAERAGLEVFAGRTTIAAATLAHPVSL
ncbi:MAG: antibiotic biosynthesis monooxygenase [Betaproteobacteria bacterium]|nr:antibiotic biosynthesis monooxygenase [Betaproteobacteria bacterium]